MVLTNPLIDSVVKPFCRSVHPAPSAFTKTQNRRAFRMSCAPLDGTATADSTEAVLVGLRVVRAAADR